MNEQTPSTVGEMTDSGYLLRGKRLEDLAQTTDVLSAAWLSWTGALPTDAQKTVLNACCILCLDHGQEPPSAHVTRVTASCGKPLADAVAAGLLTIGPKHGNAGGAAARTFRQALEKGVAPEALVREALDKGERLPGFGHPVYTEDPRTMTLVQIAKQYLPKTPHTDFALAVAEALQTAKQKPVPLNIDGAIGAVMADMGAPDALADAVFLWARTAGLVAHAMEAATLPAYLR